MPWTQTDTSFKKLSNKRITTSTGKGLPEEKGASTLELYLPDIKTGLIPGSGFAGFGASGNLYYHGPTAAFGQTLVVDTSVPGNLTWFATTGWGNTTTANDGSAGSEAQRLGDWISDKYDAFGTTPGAGYEIKVYDRNNNLITKSDNSNWLFDYQTGILVFNNDATSISTLISTSGPFKIVGWRYIGPKGIIPASYGGLGNTSYNLGDLIVGAGSTIIPLPVGTNNYILSADSSAPSGLRWIVNTGGSGSGSGISYLNNLNAGQQYFATGTSGSTFNISSSGSTHTFNIPIAGTGATGLISTQAQTIAGQKTFTSAIIGDLTGTATTAGFASTANYAYQSGYGITAGLATTATYAYQSGYAITSGLATTSTYSYQSGYATTSGFSTTSEYSYQSGYGLTSGFATTSAYSYESGYGITAGTANTANYANQAGYAITSGTASTANLALTVSFNSTNANADYNIPFLSGTALSYNSNLYFNPSTGRINSLIYTGSWAGNTITSYYGGTGYSSYTKGDILVGAGNTFIKLNVGSNNYVLGANSASGSGLTWRTASSATATTSTAPSNPISGDFWYDTTDGSLSVYYNDGDNAQWVEVAGAFTGNVYYGNVYNIPYYNSSGIAITGSTSFTNVGTGISILYTTASTSTSSGALVVSGGVGIGGSLYTGTSTADSISGVVLNNGVITLGAWAGSTITTLYGGTGYSSYTLGDILVGAGNTFIKLNAGATNYVLTSNGTSTTPSWQPVPSAAASSVAVTPTQLNQSFFLTAVSSSNGSGLGLSTITSFVINPSTGIVSASGLAVTNTTSSISSSTGALTVIGGVGIGGSLYTGTSTADSISGVVLSNGVITFGSWAGNLITALYGGTGYSSYTKGDLLVGVGNTFVKLGIGSNNQALVVDNSTSSGLKWGNVTGSGSGLSLYITDIAPVTANTGDLWFNSETAILSVNYSDVDSTQWVEIGVNLAAIENIQNVGTGITKLNNLGSSSQYFTTGTSGAGFNITSSGSYHYFNIPIASTASTGLVSGLDQTFGGNKTFSNGLISSAGATIYGSLHLPDNPLASVYGGTGYSNYSLGDLIVGAGSSTIKLAKGPDRYVLQSNPAFTSGLGWTNASGGVAISTVPPSAPFAGDLWWNSYDGSLSVFYDDIDGDGYWVEIEHGPGTGTVISGGGSGVTSLNGLSTYTQYFQVGSSGTGFNISSLGSTHTFNIPTAGNGVTGLISGTAQTFSGNKTFVNDVNISSSTASTNTSTGALIVSGGVGIQGALHTSSLVVNGTYDVVGSSVFLAGTSTTSIYNLDASIYRSVKYMVQISHGSDHQVQELLLLQDGIDTYLTQYAQLLSGNDLILATYDADLNSGNMRLLVSPTYTNTTFKIYGTAVRL